MTFDISDHRYKLSAIWYILHFLVILTNVGLEIWLILNFFHGNFGPYALQHGVCLILLKDIAAKVAGTLKITAL